MLYLKTMNETVKIESMSYGESAIAHLSSGKTVFVKGAVPGEVCEIEILQDKKNYCIAKKIDTNPLLGAPWAHIAYADQLIYKRKNVIDALVRHAGLSIETAEALVQPCIHGNCETLYRNKIEFAYVDNSLCMYDSFEKSHVAVKELAIANKPLSFAPKSISGALNYINKNNTLGIKRVGLRASTTTNSLEIALYTAPGSFPRYEVASILRDALPATSIVRVLCNKNNIHKIKGVEVLYGDGFWKENLSNYKYQVSAPSFFQVNSECAEILQDKVIEAIKLLNCKKVADLYCGCGTFTIPFADIGHSVIGIELAGSSTRDLKQNLKLNKVEADIICDDVGRATSKIRSVDAIVVDPPKKGIDKDTLSKLIALNTPGLVYVSCDPITLARDIKALMASGYKLKSVQPVDMFPQTYHIENVALLTLN